MKINGIEWRGLKALRNRIVHDYDGINLSMIWGFLTTELDDLEKQIKDIDLAIMTLMELLNSPILSIPGVGYTLGAMIISEIGDIKRFSNPSKLLAFAGLDPVVKQSGDFQASSMKISKRGSTYLRYAIYRVAFLIIYNNETFHNYYLEKRAQGKSHRSALGHVSNKLVRVIFKILTDETPFNLS